MGACTSIELCQNLETCVDTFHTLWSRSYTHMYAHAKLLHQHDIQYGGSMWLHQHLIVCTDVIESYLFRVPPQGISSLFFTGARSYRGCHPQITEFTVHTVSIVFKIYGGRCVDIENWKLINLNLLITMYDETDDGIV